MSEDSFLGGACAKAGRHGVWLPGLQQRGNEAIRIEGGVTGSGRSQNLERLISHTEGSSELLKGVSWGMTRYLSWAVILFHLDILKLESL